MVGMISDDQLAERVIERMGGLAWVLIDPREMPRCTDPDTGEKTTSQFHVAVCVLCLSAVWRSSTHADEDAYTCDDAYSIGSLTTCEVCERNLQDMATAPGVLAVRQARAHLRLLFNTNVYLQVKDG